LSSSPIKGLKNILNNILTKQLNDQQNNSIC